MCAFFKKGTADEVLQAMKGLTHMAECSGLSCSVMRRALSLLTAHTQSSDADVAMQATLLCKKLSDTLGVHAADQVNITFETFEVDDDSCIFSQQA
jgi:GTP cyclohydrolase FolE2